MELFTGPYASAELEEKYETASTEMEESNERYDRMKAVGLIEKYIIPHYDVIHTESRENVTNDMIETLKRWEEAQ